MPIHAIIAPLVSSVDLGVKGSFLLTYHFYVTVLQERQMAEYKDKRDFINSHPLFKNWAVKFKRLLEMSLMKETYSFDNVIAKQGQNFDGLFFIIS